MRQLRLVAVSEDGDHLILGSAEAADEQFSLAIDDRLRAVTGRSARRRDPAATSQPSTLSPREIQARLRAGETSDEVAGVAGVPVERITRFEGPVQAERHSRVAQARAATPHRPAGSPHEPMGELADAFLERERADADSIRWDAWLDADGQWRVQLGYTVGNRARTACWSWDVTRYHLAPLDKAASIIAEPPPDPSPLPMSTRQHAAPAPRPDPWAADEEAPISAVAADTLLADSVALTPLSVEEELSELGRLAVAAEVASRPTGLDGAEAPRSETARPDEGSGAAEPEVSVPDEGSGAAESGAAPAPPAARGSRRASVPSWDDILLGTRPQQ